MRRGEADRHLPDGDRRKAQKQQRPRPAFIHDPAAGERGKGVAQNGKDEQRARHEQPEPVDTPEMQGEEDGEGEGGHHSHDDERIVAGPEIRRQHRAQIQKRRRDAELPAHEHVQDHERNHQEAERHQRRYHQHGEAVDQPNKAKRDEGDRQGVEKHGGAGLRIGDVPQPHGGGEENRDEGGNEDCAPAPRGHHKAGDHGAEGRPEGDHHAADGEVRAELCPWRHGEDGAHHRGDEHARAYRLDEPEHEQHPECDAHHRMEPTMRNAEATMNSRRTPRRW